MYPCNLMIFLTHITFQKNYHDTADHQNKLKLALEQGHWVQYLTVRNSNLVLVQIDIYP